MVEVSFSNLWEWTILYDCLAHVIVVHMVCLAYHKWLLPTVHKCMVVRIFVPCNTWFKYVFMRVGHFLDKSIYWW